MNFKQKETLCRTIQDVRAVVRSLSYVLMDDEILAEFAVLGCTQKTLKELRDGAMRVAETHQIPKSIQPAGLEIN